MRRNVNLLRELLLRTQTYPYQQVTSQSLDGDYSYDEIIEHLLMLRDEELIEGELVQTFRRRSFFPKRVTSKGYVFLEATKPRTSREVAWRWIKLALTPTFIITTAWACLKKRIFE